MQILKKMLELDDLTANEKSLVAYIRSEPEEVLHMKPQEIAKKAFVSVSTVYRLINKLGLNGIGEFHLALVKSLKSLDKKAKVDPNFPMMPSDTPPQILDNLSKIYHNTLQETYDYLDPQELLKIVFEMKKATYIDLYAAGGNLFFAENFRFQMHEIGVLINVPEESFSQELSAANSTEEHFAIVISFGGRGQTTTEVMEILQNSGTKILLITSVFENPLAKYADYTMFMASEEDHYKKVSSFATRFSVLTLLDALYTMYFHLDYERNLQYKITNYKKINPSLK